MDQNRQILSNDISPNVQRLNSAIQSLVYSSDFVIHTAPFIRKEEVFASVSPNERRALFSKLFFFVLKSDIQYKTFIFEKKQFTDPFKLEGKMAKEISTAYARKPTVEHIPSGAAAYRGRQMR